MRKAEAAEDGRALGARVSELRRARGLSVANLADLAEVTKAYIHQIENGACPRPSAKVLFDIAGALGTSIAYLLGKSVTGPEPGTTPKPPELLEFARSQSDVTPEVVEMLASIRHRGRQPKTAQDWQYLWESIKRSIPDPDAPD